MPRVNTRTKNRAGRAYTCGRCGQTIQPGEKYYSWEFRYGGKQIRCQDHYPRASELTQSKLSTVYAAQEDLGDTYGDWLEHGDAQAAVEQLAEQVREVAGEYAEAAEPFGGQGEHQERADELEAYADELESVDIPEHPQDDDPDAWQRATDDERGEWIAAWRTEALDAIQGVELGL